MAFPAAAAPVDSIFRVPGAADGHQHVTVSSGRHGHINIRLMVDRYGPGADDYYTAPDIVDENNWPDLLWFVHQALRTEYLALGAEIPSHWKLSIVFFRAQHGGENDGPDSVVALPFHRYKDAGANTGFKNHLTMSNVLDKRMRDPNSKARFLVDQVSVELVIPDSQRESDKRLRERLRKLAARNRLAHEAVLADIADELEEEEEQVDAEEEDRLRDYWQDAPQREREEEREAEREYKRGQDAFAAARRRLAQRFQDLDFGTLQDLVSSSGPNTAARAAAQAELAARRSRGEAPGDPLDRVLRALADLPPADEPLPLRPEDRPPERGDDDDDGVERVERALAALERAELGEDEDRNLGVDDNDRLGAYDQKQIEEARPFQTVEWYRARAKWLWQIANAGDNLCLFYAIAIAERLSEHRRAKVESERRKAMRLPADKEIDKLASLAELKRIRKYAAGFEGRTELRLRTRQLFREIMGGGAREQDAFTFDDIVRAHNCLKTLIAVFTCYDGETWSLIFRSDNPDDSITVVPDELKYDERPVILLYYTPTADGHVDLVADPDGVTSQLGYRGFRLCTLCLESYRDVEKHHCFKCRDCGFPGCDSIKAYVTLAERDEKGLECKDCRVKLRTQACFERHKRGAPKGRGSIVGQSISQAREGKRVDIEVLYARRKSKRQRTHCETFKWCDVCNKRVRRQELVYNAVLRKKAPVDHQCHYVVCKHCQRYLPNTHLCTVQRYVEPERKLPSAEPEGDDTDDFKSAAEAAIDEVKAAVNIARYVFYDCECDCRDVHKPYLIRIHDGLESPSDERLTEGALGGFDSTGEFVGERLGDYDSAGRHVKVFFEGTHCMTQFIAWALEKRKSDGGFTVIAHNGSGYDWPILYPQLVMYGAGTIKDIRPLYRGSTLLAINVGRGAKAIRFIDSMLFASGKLSDFPATFGVAEQLRAAGFGQNKEFFPHWLFEVNDGVYITYEGDMPPREAYRPAHMDAKRRAEFDAWYEEERQKFAPVTDRLWDFMQQAKDYCDQDVQVLRRAMRVFRRDFATYAEVDPLQFVTLPSACLAAFRKTFMPEDSIANFSPAVNRVLRQAVYGGRTEARQFYWEPGLHEFSRTERLHYFDVNSLYPTAMVKYPFPIGHPRYFGDHTVWPSAVVKPEGPAELKDLDKYLRDGTLAILCVDVACPKNLYHPVLGVHEQTPSGTKFVFSLNDKARYWTNSPELRAAVQRGYRVTAVHAVAWWPESRVAPAMTDEDADHPSLFGSYIRTFMTLKDQAGGWPRDIDDPNLHPTEREFRRAEYLRKYREYPLNKGTDIDPDKIAANPGLKAVAKLCLNNLWGKFTQRENLPTTALFNGAQVAQFHALMSGDDREVLRIVPIRVGDPDDPFDSSGILEVVHQRPNEWYCDPASAVNPGKRAPEHSGSVHSVPIGVFTTAYARLELYALLETLGEQLVYCDTDSVVFRHDPANRGHRMLPTGPFLGQLKDECAGKTITEWFAGGPKNYGYICSDGKEVSTIKGIPRQSLLPRFQARFLRCSVLATCLGQPLPTPHVVRFSRLTRDRNAQQVRTDANAFRSYRLFNEKVALFEDGSTLPYGHVSIEFRREAFDAKKELWMERLRAACEECVERRLEQNASERDAKMAAPPAERDDMDVRPDRERDPDGKDEKGEQDDRVAVRVGGRVQMWPRDRALARLERERGQALPLFDPDEEFAREERDDDWMNREPD